MPTETPLSKANYKVKLTWEHPASRGMLPGGRIGTVFHRQPILGLPT